jgi:mono/diheme cytochrome c family protein
MKKFMKWTGIVLGGLIGLTVLSSLALYPSGKKKLTQSYPGIRVETINIPADADAIAHGRHIAIVWGCTKCHGEDLSGMLLSNNPFLGTIPASNLTSGEGGIGNSYSDADWVRAIRHGVKPDSRVESFMDKYYSTMSDQDLGNLIAYIKQIPPVDADYPVLSFGSIIPIAPAVGMFTPAAELIDHNAQRPADPAPGDTVEYGEYLFAICSECHSTNLASKLENWTQDDFIRAMRSGVLPNGKHLGPAMPRKTFGEINDMEVEALWLYFMDVKP